MNRLTLIAATGFLALALTACGEQDKKPTATTESTTTTTTTEAPAPAPAPEAAPAAPADTTAPQQ